MKIKFNCPWCEHKELKQVVRFATVSRTVTNVSEISMVLTPEPQVAGGNAPHFECGNCGTALHLRDNKPITEIKDLFELLQSADMLETE